MLWEDTVKVNRYCTVPGRLGQQYFRFMRKVELAATHYDYILYFQVRVAPFRDTRYLQEPAPATALKTLPNLNHLTLTFESTVTDFYSPWITVAGGFEGQIESHPNIVVPRLPCQKVLVDWIMCFAAEHVQHIPTVRLSGYVKSSTKQKWEAVLNDKSLRDHSKDIEQQKNNVIHTPDIAL